MTVRGYLDLARRIAQYKPTSMDTTSPIWSTENLKENEEADDEASNFSDERDHQDDEVEAFRRKSHKKSKHHKKHGKGKKQDRINETWFAFVRRAFVGAVDDEALREEFGLV